MLEDAHYLVGYVDTKYPDGIELDLICNDESICNKDGIGCTVQNNFEYYGIKMLRPVDLTNVLFKLVVTPVTLSDDEPWLEFEGMGERESTN